MVWEVEKGGAIPISAELLLQSGCMSWLTFEVIACKVFATICCVQNKEGAVWQKEIWWSGLVWKLYGILIAGTAFMQCFIDTSRQSRVASTSKKARWTRPKARAWIIAVRRTYKHLPSQFNCTKTKDQITTLFHFCFSQLGSIEFESRSGIPRTHAQWHHAFRGLRLEVHQ